jgi:hypothetical protein
VGHPMICHSVRDKAGGVLIKQCEPCIIFEDEAKDYSSGVNLLFGRLG